MDIVRRRGQTGGSVVRLQDEVNDLFNRFFEDWPLARPARAGAWWPALDVSEREDAVVVQAEVPGLKAEDLDISVRGNTLVITGEKKQSEEDRGENYYHVERRYGSFRREIALPSGVDADKTEAEYADGVLTVTLPKSEEAKPKRIQVK